jgi:CheY-like chemotaxis protein
MNAPAGNILCVEKAASSFDYVRSLLLNGSKKYLLTSVTDRWQALQLIADNRYDLYFIDYLLAEINWKVLRNRIYSIGLEKPFIFFSAKVDESTRLKVVKTEKIHYVSKQMQLNIEDLFEYLLSEKQKHDKVKGKSEFGSSKADIFFTFL